MIVRALERLGPVWTFQGGVRARLRQVRISVLGRGVSQRSFAKGDVEPGGFFTGRRTPAQRSETDRCGAADRWLRVFQTQRQSASDVRIAGAAQNTGGGFPHFG